MPGDRLELNSRFTRTTLNGAKSGPDFSARFTVAAGVAAGC